MAGPDAPKISKLLEYCAPKIALPVSNPHKCLKAKANAAKKSGTSPATSLKPRPKGALGRAKDSMKKIEAIIKPFKLDEVKEALQEVGVQALP